MRVLSSIFSKPKPCRDTQGVCAMGQQREEGCVGDQSLATRAVRGFQIAFVFRNLRSPQVRAEHWRMTRMVVRMPNIGDRRC